VKSKEPKMEIGNLKLVGILFIMVGVFIAIVMIKIMEL